MTAKENKEKTIELNDKSLDLLEIGKVDEAIGYLDEAIKLDPKHHHAHGNLAICYAMQKKFEDAKKAYKTAIELDPTQISYLTGLAAIYIDTKQYDEAEKHLELAKKIDPKNRAYLLNYGLWLFVTNKYQETIDFHEDFLKSGVLSETKKRFWVIVNYRLTFSYIEVNNIGRALEIIEECLNKPFVKNDFQLNFVFNSLKGKAENKIGG
ncbi:MAG: tetratricopeptide repeat protein [Candidatus Heimdallarchaeota archaeon]